MDVGVVILISGTACVCGFICFQKGKVAYGWMSLVGIIPFFWFLGIFGVIGALRYAKPSSRWAARNYSSQQMAVAIQRFPEEVPRRPARPPSPSPPPPDTSSKAPDSVVITEFLRQAGESGILDIETHLRLMDFLRTDQSPETESAEEEMPPEETTPLTSTPIPPPPTATPPDLPPRSSGPTLPKPRTASEPQPPPAAPPAPSPPPVPTLPNRLGKSLTNVWDAVASDVALHGLAYLGVVLTFVGVLGFLFFAFVDLPDEAQPFVELFIALVFFGWAWILRRQDAHRVANGMELIGGMVLPLILFAGLVDNAPFPPDFTDGALIVALTLTSLSVSAVYAWISWRNPESTLRFLVTPLVWLAAMTVGFVFKSDEPLTSDAITRLVSPQPALAAVAISLTLLWALYRPRHRLADPTVKAALVGVPATYLLTVSLAVGEGWDLVWPLVALGLATLVSAEVLARWYQRESWMAVARPVLLAGVLAPLVPALGPGWTGVMAAITYTFLYELNRRSNPEPSISAWLTLSGIGVGLALSVAEPWASLAAFGFVSVWAHRRRLDERNPAAESLFSSAAALLPVGLFWALGQVVGWGWASLMFAVLVVVLTVVVRRTDLEDDFWTFWLLGALLVVGLVAGLDWFDGGGTSYLGSGTLLVVAVGLGTGSRWPVARLWLTAATVSVGLAMALETAGVSMDNRQLLWAGVGLASVVTANIWRHAPAGHLAAIGHLVATGTVVSLAGGGEPYLVVGAWSLGWIVSAAGGEIGGDTFGDLVTRHLPRLGGWVVPVLASASIPPALVISANQWSTFANNRSWTGVLMASLGLVYALMSRVRTLSSQMRRTLAVSAVVASIIGVSVTAPDPWPTIYGSFALIAVAGVLARDMRQTWFVWLAWLMTVVLAVLVGSRAGVGDDSLHLVALAWGALMLIGGLITDDLRSGRRQVGEGLRTPWLKYPVLLGALVVPISLGPAFVGDPGSYGWWALGAAALYFGVAWLIRVGATTTPAYGLAALGITALSPRSLTEDPWLFVLLAAPAVGISWIAEKRQSEAAVGWFSWSAPPLIVAHVVAVVALVFAVTGSGLQATALAFGVLSIVIGLWRQQRTWREVGNLLIVVGAWDLGPGWLSLALAASSVRGMVELRSAQPKARHSYLGIATAGAGLAVPSLLIWADISPLAAANITAVVFGTLGLGVTGLRRWRALASDTAVWWGGLALVGLTGSAVYALRPGGPGVDGPWFALSLALLAAGLEIASVERGRAWFRWASSVFAALAWLTLVVGLDWGEPVAYDNTALIFGALAVSFAAIGRLGWVGSEDAMRWAGLGVLGVVTAGAFGVDPAGGIRFDGPEMAIGFAMVGIAMHLGASFARPAFRFGSVAAAGLAWAALALGVGWDAGTTATWSMPIFSGLLVGAGEYTRARRTVDRDLARAWAGLGVLGVTVAVALAYRSDIAGFWYWVGGVLAAVALSAARGAAPYRIGWLRELSMVAGLSSCVAFAMGADVSDVAIAGGILVVAAMATLVSLVVWKRVPETVWLRPLIVLGVMSNVVALVMALDQLPQVTLLVGVLLSIGVQAIAVGLTMSLPGVLAVGPPVLAAAFVLSVAQSVGGSSQWYTVPLGIVVLTEVEILRLLPRFSAEGGDRTSVIVAEWCGIGLLAAPPLVEMFTISLFLGFVALGVAIAVLLWGIVTRVRRRVVAAMCLTLATAVLMLFAAAAAGAPDSAFFWVLAVGIGFAVMVVAGLIEAYRSKKGKAMARLDQLMEGWE